ncbi:FecR family protein [Negadavirga shengliensis]|uniref:FecR family protein n=1 Tax=Negadavirga shengliensis TaxID=1389218 RepID=A0ABV9T758_9BACT
MDIANYTTEDFVLDPSFRTWVLHPNAESNLAWEQQLAAHPSKYPEAKKAREIIIHLSTKEHRLSDEELWSLWEVLDGEMSENTAMHRKEKVIPLNAYSTLYRSTPRRGWVRGILSHAGYRVASMLVFVMGLGFLASYFLTETATEELPPVVYEERSTVPGLKAHFTLSDGSKVILNSGSKLRYVKNFGRDRREIFLEGEAFFTVAKDSLRPFVVQTGEVKTTALGTSFNIKSYGTASLDISLLTGKVSVEMPLGETPYLTLIPGEALNINIPDSQIMKGRFEEEMVIGWTKKLLIFQQTPLPEAIRTLENWYGVTFEIHNQPEDEVLFSGRFHDETLEIVLSGLSYAAKFDFEINKDKVTIRF